MDLPNLNEIRFEVMRDGAIKPTIGTKGSAGYDISIPTDYQKPIVIEPGKVATINSGIRAAMPLGVVLMLYVRSSIGIKRGLVLTNGTGVIDSDYYGNQKNGGEIIISLRNVTDSTVTLNPGERVIQGIFVPYFLTDEDTLALDTEGAFAERTGGIGSTNTQEQLNA